MQLQDDEYLTYTQGTRCVRHASEWEVITNKEQNGIAVLIDWMCDVMDF